MSDPLVPVLAVFVCCLLFTLVLFAWRDRWRSAASLAETTVPDAGKNLQVTMVVPARNAARTLSALLQDLNAQTIDKDRTEVLVVDDASEDGSAAIVRGMSRIWPQLKLVQNDGVGKKAGITTALKQAQGDIIVLTDADGRCERERVARILARMGSDDLDLLLLPIRTIGGSGMLGSIQQMEQAALVGMAAGEALMGRPGLANGANMAFKRSAFEKVEGYVGDDHASGDDVFLVQRMRKAGMRIGYLVDPLTAVTVEVEETWSGFVQQRLRWAGKMRSVSGASFWSGPVALLLPWALLYVTCAVDILSNTEGHRVETMALLVMAWALWLFPVPALVGEVRSTLGQRRTTVTAMMAFCAFTIYAPTLALLALFIRPTWKGRVLQR